MVESERTVSKFRKRKRKFLRCVHQLRKAAAWKVHVALLQRRLRSVQKIRDERAKLFCLLTFFLFCRSRCRRRRRRRCLSFLLLRSRNFASMVTCRYLPTLSGLGPRLYEPHRTWLSTVSHYILRSTKRNTPAQRDKKRRNEIQRFYKAVSLMHWLKKTVL